MVIYFLGSMGYRIRRLILPIAAGALGLATLSLLISWPSDSDRGIGKSTPTRAAESWHKSGTESFSAKSRIRNNRAASDIIWIAVENEQRDYLETFQPDSKPGLARAMWINSPTVRFWMEQLRSSKPERVALAINVLEMAAARNPQEFLDANGNWKAYLGPAERECIQIQRQMQLARAATIANRVALNKELSTAELDDDVAEIENRVFFLGGSDDGGVVRDAAIVLETFVPRLNAEDSSVVDHAYSVLDMFTLDLFSGESADWWKTALSRLENNDLGSVLE